MRVALRRAARRAGRESRATRRQDRHHRRGRRAGHSAACAGAHFRALLHRPTRSGLRSEFRPRPVDLAADRRGAWRPHLGREPPAGVRRRARAPPTDDGRRASRPATAPARASSFRLPAIAAVSARAPGLDERFHATRAGGRRSGRARPRPLGRGQERACARAARPGRASDGFSPRLIGDDRVLSAPLRPGGCWRAARPASQGLIERRGYGIVAVADEPCAVVTAGRRSLPCRANAARACPTRRASSASFCRNSPAPPDVRRRAAARSNAPTRCWKP